MRSRFDRSRLTASDLGLSDDSTATEAAVAIAGTHRAHWPRFGDDDLLDMALGHLDRAQEAIEGYTDPDPAASFATLPEALTYYGARAEVVAALIA